MSLMERVENACHRSIPIIAVGLPIMRCAGQCILKIEHVFLHQARLLRRTEDHGVLEAGFPQPLADVCKILGGRRQFVFGTGKGQLPCGIIGQNNVVKTIDKIKKLDRIMVVGRKEHQSGVPKGRGNIIDCFVGQGVVERDLGGSPEDVFLCL